MEENELAPHQKIPVGDVKLTCAPRDLGMSKMPLDVAIDGLRKIAWALRNENCPASAKLIEEAIDILNEMAKALSFAAGYISGMPQFKDKHPEEVLDWLLEEGKKLE